MSLASLLLVGCSSTGASVDAGGEPDAATVFDLGADFSGTRNPSGVWSYGFTSGGTLAVSEFRPDGFSAQVGGVAFWHPDGDAGYYPYVAWNPGASTITDSSGSWAVRAGEVAMEGSASGQYSVVEFVAPADGRYSVRADFEGIHFRISTTDVHVRQNDVPLFDANIDGYGGDPAFHPVQGSSPSATYVGSVDLKVGDVLGFAVGIGADGTNFNDTTGLLVHIVRL